MTDLEKAAAELANADREWHEVIASWPGPWEDVPREIRAATRAADARKQAAVARLVVLGIGVLSHLMRKAG